MYGTRRPTGRLLAVLGLLAALLVVTVVGTLGVGILVALSASPQGLVGLLALLLLGGVVAVVGVAALVLALGVVLAGYAVATAQTVVSVRRWRLSRWFDRLETTFPPLREFELPALAAPNAGSVEPAVDDLKRRYVRGDIDEATFERRLDRLFALERRVRSEPSRQGVGSERRSGHDDPGRRGDEFAGRRDDAERTPSYLRRRL